MEFNPMIILTDRGYESVHEAIASGEEDANKLNMLFDCTTDKEKFLLKVAIFEWLLNEESGASIKEASNGSSNG